MSDLALESLANQVEALEWVIATKELCQPRKDWRRVVGVFRNSEFMCKLDEECLRVREGEQDAAWREESAE